MDAKAFIKAFVLEKSAFLTKENCPKGLKNAGGFDTIENNETFEEKTRGERRMKHELSFGWNGLLTAKLSILFPILSRRVPIPWTAKPLSFASN